jgi:hypothetical protein
MSPRTLRTINILFWIAVYTAIVIWTETWGHWVPMIAQTFIPAMLGGYLHLVLGRTGTSME